jgi:hypothetical protein
MPELLNEGASPGAQPALVSGLAGGSVVRCRRLMVRPTKFARRIWWSLVPPIGFEPTTVGLEGPVRAGVTVRRRVRPDMAWHNS